MHLGSLPGSEPGPRTGTGTYPRRGRMPTQIFWDSGRLII